MQISINAYPENETKMIVSTRLHLQNMKPGNYTTVFSQPKKMRKFVDTSTNKDLTYSFTTIPGVPDHINVKLMEFTVESSESSQVLLFEYEYDGESFVGYALNPSTLDNLHLGQIRKESIFSSHLRYYPYMHTFSGSDMAELIIQAPMGWKAVTSGALRSVITDDNDKTTTFTYEADFHSGRLPYPLAIYPYKKTSLTYDADRRLPVTIYHAEDSSVFARQKADLIEKEILPFLEHLMGPYPFESLKIVEVFPWEGNTGLAARGLVMLSKNIWFAVDIAKDWREAPSPPIPILVLVDEIAHQWNFYHVQLPNFLAEGMSEYTNQLFNEHVYGEDMFQNSLKDFRDSYTRIVGFIEKLHKLHSQGMSMEEAAKELERPPEEVSSFWPYAERGNVPITDPQVFPALYFIRGFMALHALREELGDESFFKAFKTIFTEKNQKTQWTLSDFREHFENETDSDLKSFFYKWYESVDLPH